MTKIAVPFTLLISALACSLSAMPAQAQRARVFVASYGSDSNSCSFTQSCRTFQAAVTAVLAGGEVTAIDSAGFSPMTINKAVTITSPPGIEAGIAPSAGGTAITIAAGPNDVVVLRGLTLEGAATGQTGIAFADGAGLEILDCVIRNFTQTGISVGPGTFISLLISNTRVLDNPTAGIALEPAQGASSNGQIFATIDHVTVNNNGYGIFSNNTAGDTRAVITNSVISFNATAGIALTNGTDSHGSAHGAEIAIKDSTISHNDFSFGEPGISVSGSSASTVLLSRSLIYNNDTEIMISGASNLVYSAGDNDMFAYNHLITGETLQSNPKQ
jgi:hypothetical protein